MKRVKLLSSLMLLASGGVYAQSSTTVTVQLSQPGPSFYVDGQTYASVQTFLWPIGSTHILQFPFSVVVGQTQPYQSSNYDTARWTFSGWTDNLGFLTPVSNQAVQIVTVVKGMSSIIGNVSESLEFTLAFPPGTGSGLLNGACPTSDVEASSGTLGWGLVYLNNVCYADTVSVYLPAGTVTMNAFPYPGYGFVGFQINSAPASPALASINLTQPAQSATAIFATAKLVSFRTNPPGLEVTVDSVTIGTPPAPPTSVQQLVNGNPACNPSYAAVPVGAPAGIVPLCIGDYDFLPGSQHKIGAPPTQEDPTGAWWVFNGFSDGLGQNGIYLTDAATNYADAVTANFLPGMVSALLTNPPGLKLSVDGTTAWQSYYFIWGQGSSHALIAPATQVDSSGRTWQFSNWSNGGSESQTITVPTTGQAYALTANYTLLGQVQVTSMPPGLTFTVGGSSCTTPCAVNQPAGATVQISIPSSVPLSQTSRLNFGSWSGGATSSSTSLQVTLTQAAVVYTANYYTSYLLIAASNPANDATFKTAPPSPDGFFPAGTQIAVTPVPNTGFKFLSWGGDLSGPLSPGYLTMNSAHSIVANVQGVPAISPAGIVSAAGVTPDGSVAPGSIISIYGENLAGPAQIGPTDPLAQTLGNVTVMVNGILMPLMFVSPGQINAQVPVELTPGSYTLSVQWQGQAPVSGTFTVSRDAPGFYIEPNDQNISLVAALHQDGTLITLDSPARRGEIVSMYGTGFGPFTQPTIDGFPAQMTAPNPTVDPVVVNAATVSAPAIWAGAAPDMVGATVVQFKIVDSIPSATNVNITVTAGGKPSTIVQLPVE